MENKFALKWLLEILGGMACQMNAAISLHVLKTLLNRKVFPINLVYSCTILDHLIMNGLNFCNCSRDRGLPYGIWMAGQKQTSNIWIDVRFILNPACERGDIRCVGGNSIIQDAFRA